MGKQDVKSNQHYKQVDLVRWTLKQNEVVPLLKGYVERVTTNEDEKKLYRLFVEGFLSFSQQTVLCDELDRRVKES